MPEWQVAILIVFVWGWGFMFGCALCLHKQSPFWAGFMDGMSLRWLFRWINK